jgi:hypothetical protein
MGPILAACALGVGAHGATVVFRTASLVGAPVNRTITITQGTDPLGVYTNIIFNTPRVLQPVGGTATATNLQAGNYWVSIDTVPKRMWMPVPDSTNTYNAIDLITDGLKHLVTQTNYTGMPDLPTITSISETDELAVVTGRTPFQVAWQMSGSNLLESMALFSNWAAHQTGGGGGSNGVSAFNTRTGAVSLNAGDVSSALGFTPLDAAPTGWPVGVSNVLAPILFDKYFNAKAYGAKGNGVLLASCVVNSGSATLSCGSAAFAPADAGKVISVVSGQGNGSALTTTIAAYISASQVTLSALPTTNTTTYAVYGSDDTSAIQSGLNAVAAASGGTLVFPEGIYIANGALQDPGTTNTHHSAQIIYPENANAARPCEIGMLGIGIPLLKYPAAWDTHGSMIWSTLVTNYGNVFECSNPDNPAYWSGVDNVGQTGSIPFNPIQVTIKNMRFRCSQGSGVTALNLAGAQTANMESVLIDYGPNEYGDQKPTVTTSCGVKLPAASNAGGGSLIMENVSVFGFYTGFATYEHTLLLNCVAADCWFAYFFPGGGHTASLVNCNAEGCHYVTGGHDFQAPVDVQVTVEHTFTNVWSYPCFIADDNGGMSGTVRYNWTTQAPSTFLPTTNDWNGAAPAGGVHFFATGPGVSGYWHTTPLSLDWIGASGAGSSGAAMVANGSRGLVATNSLWLGDGPTYALVVIHTNDQPVYFYSQTLPDVTNNAWEFGERPETDGEHGAFAWRNKPSNAPGFNEVVSMETNGDFVLRLGGYQGLVRSGAETNAAGSRVVYLSDIPTSLPPNGAAGGALAGTFPSPTLAAVNGNIGTYGDSTDIPVITVTAGGQITGVSTVPISGGGGGGTLGTTNATLWNTASGATIFQNTNGPELGRITTSSLIWKTNAEFQAGISSPNPAKGGSEQFGSGATASATNAFAIGVNAQAAGTNSFAGGNNSQATGDDSVALGGGPSGHGPIAFGFQSMAEGYNAQSQGDESLALGPNAFGADYGDIAIGLASTTTGATNALALGVNAQAGFNNSTAVGNNSATTKTNQVALGNAYGSVLVPGSGGISVVQELLTNLTSQLLIFPTGTNTMVQNVNTNASGGLTTNTFFFGGGVTSNLFRCLNPSGQQVLTVTTNGIFVFGTNSAITFDASGNIVATSFAGDGSLLTALNASQLTTGTMPIGRMPAMTGGDATTPAGSGNITLATVNGNVGTVGDATHVAQITLDGKGRATAAASVLITGTTPGGSAGGRLAGTYPNPTFAAYSSAQLALDLNDETGSGLAVFSGAPTITNTTIKGNGAGTNAFYVDQTGGHLTNNLGGLDEVSNNLTNTGYIAAGTGFVGDGSKLSGILESDIVSLPGDLSNKVSTNDSRNLVLSGTTNFIGTDVAATRFWGDGTHITGSPAVSASAMTNMVMGLQTNQAGAGFKVIGISGGSAYYATNLTADITLAAFDTTGCRADTVYGFLVRATASSADRKLTNPVGVIGSPGDGNGAVYTITNSATAVGTAALLQYTIQVGQFTNVAWKPLGL